MAHPPQTNLGPPALSTGTHPIAIGEPEHPSQRSPDDVGGRTNTAGDLGVPVGTDPDAPGYAPNVIPAYPFPGVVGVRKLQAGVVASFGTNLIDVQRPTYLIPNRLISTVGGTPEHLRVYSTWSEAPDPNQTGLFDPDFTFAPGIPTSSRGCVFLSHPGRWYVICIHDAAGVTAQFEFVDVDVSHPGMLRHIQEHRRYPTFVEHFSVAVGAASAEALALAEMLQAKGLELQNLDAANDIHLAWGRDSAATVAGTVRLAPGEFRRYGFNHLPLSNLKAIRTGAGATLAMTVYR